MPNDLMSGLFSEMDRVREIVKEYDEQPRNAGAFASWCMRRDIQRAEKAIKANDTVEMIFCYSSLKEYEL